MYAGSLPEGIVPSGTPERDNDSLYGTPKEEVGPNAQAIHFQGNKRKGLGFRIPYARRYSPLSIINRGF